jgi:hypothetical protein
VAIDGPLDHSVITMETVSRLVGGLPLVAEANHAKFHSSNKTCDFVVCCLLCTKGPDLTLEDSCLQDSSWISVCRCCMIRSDLDRSFGGYYGSHRKLNAILEGCKLGTAFGIA